MRLKNITRHERWFAIPGENASLLVRELAPGDLAEIRDTVLMFGESSSPSSAKAEFRREYVARHVADWKGVDDEEGKPLPVTYENKMLFLMQEGMPDFTWSCIAKVREEADKTRGEAEKN